MRSDAAVYRNFSGTQQAFDCRSQLSANALKVPRYAGFVFAKFAADFREGTILSVVEAQTLTITHIERCQCRRERLTKFLQIHRAVRIDRNVHGAEFGYATHFSVVAAIVQRIEFPAGTDGINVALRKHRAQPGL